MKMYSLEAVSTVEEKGKNGVNMKQQTPEVHPLTLLYTIFLEKGTPRCAYH